MTFSDKGQKPGPHDRLVTRAKPRNQPANLPAEPWAAPPGTLTVSLVRLRRPALPGRTKTTTESLRDAEMKSASRLARNSSTAQWRRSLTSCTAVSSRSMTKSCGTAR